MLKNTLTTFALSLSIALTRDYTSARVRRIRKSAELTREERVARNTAFCLRNVNIPENPAPAKSPVTIDDDFGTDDGWTEYLESMEEFTVAENDGSIESSYAAAERIRDSYRKWLCSKIEESHGTWDDTSFLEEELERLQSADDTSLNRWGTRPELSDLEYGLIDSQPREGEAGFGYLDMLDAAKQGPELTWVNEKGFVSKADAQAFVDKTRAAFKKGNHSAEIIGCESRKGQATPFVAVVLEADGNWSHRKALSAERDRHMANALRHISEATTRQQLNKLAGIIKKYSRDMQVLNQGHTHDNARVVSNRQVGRKCRIGFDYKRFATCMNAVAARAEELGFTGFRTYKINEFNSTRKLTDGDMLDCGCAQGLFLALEQIDETVTEEALWSQIEGTWKPSRELAPTCLVYRNPAYVFGPACYSDSRVRAA